MNKIKRFFTERSASNDMWGDSDFAVVISRMFIFGATVFALIMMVVAVFACVTSIYERCCS